MPLPVKSYFFLSEVAEGWGASLPDIACYAQEGLLELSVMTVGTAVELGQTGDGPGNESVCIPIGNAVLHGLQPLRPEDVWEVFRRGVSRVRALKAEHGYIKLQDESGLEISTADLLIARSERERFEREYDMGGSCSLTQTTSQPHHALIHNDGYRHVILSGQSFSLGCKQAAVVMRLHEASQRGAPWLSGDYLLTEAGSNSSRLVDLFKSQPNWRSLLRSDGKGSWSLNLPEVTARRNRAFRRPHLRLVS